MKSFRLRDVALAVFLISVIIACLIKAGKIGVSMSQANAALYERSIKNTLIISVCSLRRDLLGAYGHQGVEIMPNLEKFFRESTLVFSNMYNGIPWISIIAFFDPYFPELREKGFTRPGPFTDDPYIRIPLQKTYESMEFRDTNDSDWEKDYKKYFEYARSSLLSNSTLPFVLVTHIKYMHYPLIDYFNADSEWDYYLNDSEKALIKEYLAHKEIYYAKLPFLLMLTSDPEYAIAHPGVPKLKPGEDRRKLLGYVTNDKYLREWKLSANYQTDLAILKKVYAGNARYLDSHIVGPLVNLFGDKELKLNTQVVFAGDHGELHMERDKLTHATSPYDEALAIPAAVYIPGGQHGPEVVNEQMHIHSLADFAKDIAENTVRAVDAPQKVKKYFSDAIIMRDCTNTIHALRYKNEYKYIIDDASGTRQLFDLTKDPGEEHDIAGAQPELAARMEAAYWSALPRFKLFPPYRCAPWDSKGGDNVSL